MIRSTVLLGAGSIAGLIAQAADTSLWTKSAWVIMCCTFASAIGVMARYIQQVVTERLSDKDKQIAGLMKDREELPSLLDAQAEEYRRQSNEQLTRQREAFEKLLQSERDACQHSIDRLEAEIGRIAKSPDGG